MFNVLKTSKFRRPVSIWQLAGNMSRHTLKGIYRDFFHFIFQITVIAFLIP